MTNSSTWNKSELETKQVQLIEIIAGNFLKCGVCLSEFSISHISPHIKLEFDSANLDGLFCEKVLFKIQINDNFIHKIYLLNLFILRTL